MINRRTLLRTLVSLGGLAPLISGCKHRPSYGRKKEPENQGSY